ncbi:amino acid adenylation domain-containing protein [Streptomyces sp. NPDC097619]|uniref:amino acid adenylation domain-containing protein n=1 Tax=Streptomyces sp. NPDC097619 TaxID=3157228 RepID=UPI003324CDED
MTPVPSPAPAAAPAPPAPGVARPAPEGPPWPVGEPVPLLIARQAARTPDAIAVRAPGGDLTYRELDLRARAVAAELRAAGAGPEDPVLVGVRRDTAWAVAVLGIWYAGAAPLLVDLDAPDERLRALTAASGARHAVTTGHAAAARLHERCGAPLLWARTGGTHTGPPVGDRDAPGTVPGGIPAQGLAYVLFTSGSTGAPKPVAVGHAGLARQARALAGRYALTPADRVLQFAAPAFDVALEEAVPTWCAGGTAVFLADNVLAPAELEAVLTARGVTVVNLPTPYWAQWTADLVRAPRPLPADLRLTVIGSDAGRTADLDRWRAAGGPRTVSCYGLTESTITATSYEPAPAGADGLAADVPGTGARAGDPTGLIPLGVPLPGVRAYVLDEELREVPAGAAGELYLAGACLARGYHGRAALTAERFVADPFAAEPGERMYRTGDRVRRGADGTLGFLGRTDDQVKIRGHRVELREAEAAVAAHPDVADAVVRALRGTGEPRLAAWVVLAPGAGAADGPELRRSLLGRIPSYLVPADVVIMAELPRTPGGKLDARALPAPAPAAERAA